MTSESAALGFREKLFASCGTPETYNAGEAIIEEGRESGCAVFIKEGEAVLRKKGSSTELARRKMGDMIGEMTFLLSDMPTVSVVAIGKVQVLTVSHDQLMRMLEKDPSLAGRLFKMMAATLSERISEGSAKMRSEVVAKSAKKGVADVGAQKAPTAAPHTQASAQRYRELFGLPRDATLLLHSTCSMRKEAGSKKEEAVQFGDLFVWSHHLCFDWKAFGFHKQQTIPFKSVLALLRSAEAENTFEVQCKGSSYEMTVSEHSERTWTLMESCRRAAQQRALASKGGAMQTLGDVCESLDPEIEQAFVSSRRRNRNSQGSHHGLEASASQRLTESDWGLFLAGAQQRKYKRGEYILVEGKPTQALFQIVQGSLNVELRLQGGGSAVDSAVVVGKRGAGDMFGETSLLKAGNATASIVCESEEATLICIEGAHLERLFETHPKLPGRFFAYLAQYQARRLRALDESRLGGGGVMAVAGGGKVRIEEIFATPAYIGIFRKFLFKSAESVSSGAKSAYAMSIANFEFWMDVEDFKSEPHEAEMRVVGAKIVSSFVEPGAPMALACIDGATRKAISRTLAAGASTPQQLRKAFDVAQARALKSIGAQCYEAFLSSEHFVYILELKSKEGIVPALVDFRLVRVLGQGGFGQVLEVVKRDCGKRYAMKVMHKEAMRRQLGSSWRKKIWLEKDLMATLSHPMLVNLHYSFQNQEFLVLVMDLVSAGDLSEFVLTKKRLTAEQVQFIVMETVCVLAYCHSQSVLYRDLKPENLLIDDMGHVRLIDMGLAARITKKTPKRRSRVGTDCYMAPEVRYARDRREMYGTSCDWYTVGVLTYEFSAGRVPFADPKAQPPVYRPHAFADPHCEDFVKRLLDQDHKTRLGCGARGVKELLEHPYFRGVEWELVPSKKFASPCKGLKGPQKRRKEKESAAVEVASHMSEAEREAHVEGYAVGDWDFVSKGAVNEEYLENIYQCVSSI